MDIDLQMIEEPEGAYIGNAPAYLDVCGKAALVALALYCMVIVAFILLRRTVIEEEDIKQYFRLQCIAAMPYTKVVGKGRLPMISRDGSRYFNLKDAVGNIRRSIERDAQEQHHKVYLFDGALDGEGTTTVAINAALALAAKGYRTIFADCDFSKSASKQIHRMMEHKNLHVVRAEKKLTIKLI
jgi:hypothetical protein